MPLPKEGTSSPQTITIELLEIPKDPEDFSDDFTDFQVLNQEAFLMNTPATLAEYKAFLCQKNVFTVAARDDKKTIVGKATLSVHLEKDGARFGSVGGFVVLREYKGKGIEDKIEDFLCEIALEKKCSFMDMTNETCKREIAILCEEKGYEQIEMGTYRKALDE